MLIGFRIILIYEIHVEEGKGYYIYIRMSRWYATDNNMCSSSLQQMQIRDIR